MRQYGVNEMFFSLQGEGVRAGKAHVFLRFSGCNLKCAMEPGPKSPGGFDCDTDFSHSEQMTAEQIHAEALKLVPHAFYESQWMLLTGGEPGLQVDDELIALLHAKGWKLAIETNGTIQLPAGLDWVTVSPKMPDADTLQRTASEVKFVVPAGKSLPETRVEARHYLISPVFNNGHVDRQSLAWCIQLVKDNPTWRLSVQQHKLWAVR